MTRPTGECTTNTSRNSISFSAASKNNYKYVWKLQTRYGQRSFYPLHIVFMWNCLQDFPNYCIIFHFIDRTTFYAITNRFVQLAVRHAYIENLRSLVGISLRVSDDGKWPPGLSAKLLHTALRILQQNNKFRHMSRTGDRGTPENSTCAKLAISYLILAYYWITKVTNSYLARRPGKENHVRC
jgi:hypothetical protein